MFWTRLRCKARPCALARRSICQQFRKGTIMSKLADRIFSVLVADDSEVDRMLLKTAVVNASRLQITGEVADGSQAIAYLKSCASLRKRKTFPDLLLLDLKMPRMDGFQVLEWLRVQSFRQLTVVVMTDSMQPEHIKRALDLGADMFQVKPTTAHDRETMIRALEEHLVSASAKSRQIVPAHLRVAPRPGVGAY